MKNIKTTLIVLALSMMAILLSCEEEERDTLPTGPVSNTLILSEDKSVIIYWTDPADIDFEKVIITYTDEIEHKIEVSALVEQKTITGLTNDQLYTFKLIAVDKSGNESEEVLLTATPELRVFSIQGSPIENGTYSFTDEYSFITTYVFSGTNTLDISVQAGVNTFSWSGTWSSTLEIVNTVMENTTTGAITNDLISAAFCYELDNKKYFYHGAFIKNSGEDDEIAGDYSYSIYSSNGGTNLIKSITIAEDGTYEYFNNYELESTGTINDDDIRNHDYLFIHYGASIFLLFDKSFILEKQ
jgi:hypothetical protein